VALTDAPASQNSANAPPAEQPPRNTAPKPSPPPEKPQAPTPRQPPATAQTDRLPDRLTHGPSPTHSAPEAMMERAIQAAPSVDVEHQTPVTPQLPGTAWIPKVLSGCAALHPVWRLLRPLEPPLPWMFRVQSPVDASGPFHLPQVRRTHRSAMRFAGQAGLPFPKHPSPTATPAHAGRRLQETNRVHEASSVRAPFPLHPVIRRTSARWDPAAHREQTARPGGAGPRSEEAVAHPNARSAIHPKGTVTHPAGTAAHPTAEEASPRAKMARREQYSPPYGVAERAAPDVAKSR
jgi:hypothetical protein